MTHRKSEVARSCRLLTCLATLVVVAGSASATNYNNTRSNRSSIAGPGVTTLWTTTTGVYLNIVGLGDEYGFVSNIDPSPPGDLPLSVSSVFIPALGEGFLLGGVEPTNDRPFASRSITTVSEELNGTDLNRSRVFHTGSLTTDTFSADSTADAFLSDLGTAVAFTSDRLRFDASMSTQLEFFLESIAEFDLNLAAGQDGFAGVLVDWAFGRIDGSGETLLLSDTFGAEFDTFDGLNPNGVTGVAYALPTDLPVFQLEAGESYFLTVNIVNYSRIVPSPSTVIPLVAYSVFVCRRRR